MGVCVFLIRKLILSEPVPTILCQADEWVLRVQSDRMPENGTFWSVILVVPVSTVLEIASPGGLNDALAENSA